MAGLITALFGFMQFVTAPILGELSDIWGRKKLLLLGVVILAASQFLFAGGVATASILLLLVSRVIGGIAGANFSIAQAVIADITPPEKRAQNFGIIGAAFGVGFILGPLLGGIIAGSTGNPAVPFIFAGLLGIINALSVTFFLPETHHERTRRKQISVFKALHNIQAAFNDPEARPIYFVSFFVLLGFGFFTSFSAVFLANRFGYTESAIGTYFAVVGGWIIFSQLVVVRYFSRRYASRTLLTWSIPVLALVILSYPFIYHPGLLYLTMPLLAGAFGLISTALPALVSQGVTRDKQGAALGINGSLQALSQAVAPLVAGVVAGSCGLAAAFFMGTILVLVGYVIVSTTNRSEPV